MTIHMLHRKIADLRRSSRWPDQDDFSAELGVSLGGYKKYETGRRIPHPAVMREMCKKLRLSEEDAEELWRLRDDAKAKQLGLSLPGPAKNVDPEALAKRIENEVFFVLKQAGIVIPKREGPILRNRIGMILKTALGE